MQYTTEILAKGLPAKETFYALRLAFLLAEAPTMPPEEVEQIALNKKWDKSSNGVTNQISECCKYLGIMCNRQQSTGKWDPRKNKFVRSNSKKGIADLRVKARGGIDIEVEVKAGKDRMRPDQIKYKAEIEAQGGTYIVVKTFEDWFDQFFAIVRSKGVQL